MLCSAQMASAQVIAPPSTQPARSVTLTLSEYNRLLDLAYRPVTTPPPAPVAAVLSNAEMRVRVDGSAATGTFTLAGQVLRPGVNRVTLLSDATVLDASADGHPLPLLMDGRSHQALFSGPGPFSATLEWGSPVIFKPGRASFMLSVPPAGAAHATIEVPGEQADVHLSAGSIIRRTTQDGRTMVEAALDPASATEVSWSMRDSAPVAAARESRTVADVMSLITLADSDVRMVALVDLTVVQGEPRTVELQLPAGYQLMGITGSTLETSEPADNKVVLTLADPAARRHQFLVSLERPHPAGSFSLDTALVQVSDVQRERGEIAVEGVGTLDLAATERQGMHRVDIRELNSALQSLARTPLLAGFRYQRTPSSVPGVALAVTRFPDSSVLAAVVDRLAATTLITTEGRALTEVQMWVRNHAQPFVKVSLPPGATMVSVEVAGEPAKPVSGDDGSRVPLLRPGFRPTELYSVSFVYLHAGTPFGRKGDLAMTLPRMDIPVGLVDWEVFAPEKYSMRYINGNAIPRQAVERVIAARKVQTSSAPRAVDSLLSRVGSGGGIVISLAAGEPSGTLRGVVRDTSGAALPGVTIEVATVGRPPFKVISDAKGTFRLASIPQGVATIAATLPGFTTAATNFVVGKVGTKVDIQMKVGSVEETVTVSSNSPRVDTVESHSAVARSEAPSENVIDLQRRVAGVLPIRVDVPKAGTAYYFARPLVVDEDTHLSFHYSRR
ncbi:MAG TPA: carboxypeptidase-like regulatory domain-containing protein [Vicinamibacterales bacterium]